jgi:hypothetical protein
VLLFALTLVAMWLPASIGNQIRGASDGRAEGSADAVLLAAADAVANKRAELMGDARPEAAVVPLRRAAQ